MRVYLRFITIITFLLLVVAITGFIIANQPSALPGDVNGDGIINRTDLDLVHQHLLRFIELDDSQKARADMNQDGEITVLDLLRIHKYIGGD